MHFNYHFLQRLVPEIKQNILGLRLYECYSQSKDEIVLGFSREGKNDFYVKAQLSQQIACLSFKDEIFRAKKNSINLFKEIIEKKVTDVGLFLNERSFYIDLEDDFRLVFKLFGNRANLILFENKTPQKLFNNHFEQDIELNYNLDRPLNQTSSDFEENGLYATFPTLAPLLKEFSEFENLSQKEQFSFIQSLLNQWKDSSFYLSKNKKGFSQLRLFSSNEEEQSFENAIDAANAFYYTFTSEYNLDFQKNKWANWLHKKIKSYESYIKKTSHELEKLEQSTALDEIGHIIMANLHQIPKNISEVTLFDFYREKDITIALKKDQTPQKNAENYYRKHKNQKKQFNKLYENLEHKELQLEKTNQLYNTLLEINDYRDLKKFLKEQGFEDKKIEKEKNAPKFKTYSFQGYKIYVGRNSGNNDELTQKFASKDDLWLHAKDVSGSHVVIRTQSGKTVPKPVLELAAEIAAFYSQRKTDSLCPVMYTPKKFVRKIKGAPKGAVIVDQEKVILVPPTKHDEYLDQV